jgi:hypothetical protein
MSTKEIIEAVTVFITVIGAVFGVGKIYQNFIDKNDALENTVKQNSIDIQKDKEDILAQIKALKDQKADETRWIVEQHTQQISALAIQMQNNINTVISMERSLTKVESAVEHMVKWMERQDSN